jgi:hypothetical protein
MAKWRVLPVDEDGETDYYWFIKIDLETDPPAPIIYVRYDGTEEKKQISLMIAETLVGYLNGNAVIIPKGMLLVHIAALEADQQRMENDRKRIKDLLDGVMIAGIDEERLHRVLGHPPEGSRIECGCAAIVGAYNSDTEKK